VQRVVNAAVDAVSQVPTSHQDRRQFQRTFGRLYVVDTAGGGTCCAPRQASGSDD
jgi:hypothetical protein